MKLELLIKSGTQKPLYADTKLSHEMEKKKRLKTKKKKKTKKKTTKLSSIASRPSRASQ